MNVILVTGGRDYALSMTDKYYDREIHVPQFKTMKRVLGGQPANSVLIHGKAKGADSAASRIAWVYDYHEVPIEYAGWLGKAGGHARNAVMVELARGMYELGHTVNVYAFGGNRGTQNCIDAALKAGLPVKEFDR